MKKENIDDWFKKRKEHREKMNPDEIFDGILRGDIAELSSGITLIESQNQEHRANANKLIQLCLPHSGKSIRIGVTGVPGVGKSTFIEAFGAVLTAHGKKVAVLAIDPSSSVSGGSILGDKTRMNTLSTRNDVFIRPSPAGDNLGGVARRTRESILLCEAAGFDVILIETVGVGQSETTVKSMVDFFLLLMLAGAGDELQGIKKGIMEMADAVVINKADGDNVQKAKLASSEYKNALHLFPPNPSGWIPEVFTISSVKGSNIDKVYELIDRYAKEMKENGFLHSNRHEQDKRWLNETLKELILSDFYSNEEFLNQLKECERKVADGLYTSFQAAEFLYKKYKDG